MSTDGAKAVLLRRDGPVTELVLNRPDHLNAIDDELADGLLGGWTWSVGMQAAVAW